MYKAYLSFGLIPQPDSSNKIKSWWDKVLDFPLLLIRWLFSSGFRCLVKPAAKPAAEPAAKPAPGRSQGTSFPNRSLMFIEICWKYIFLTWTTARTNSEHHEHQAQIGKQELKDTEGTSQNISLKWLQCVLHQRWWRVMAGWSSLNVTIMYLDHWSPNQHCSHSSCSPRPFKIIHGAVICSDPIQPENALKTMIKCDNMVTSERHSIALLSLPTGKVSGNSSKDRLMDWSCCLIVFCAGWPGWVAWTAWGSL